MRWPFRRPETRSSWADAIARLQALIAEDGSYSDVVKTAASEIAAGILERSFFSATVQTDRAIIKDALPPGLLGYVGRQLILRGEVCLLVHVENGLALLPCSNWEIYSTMPARSTWTYEVHCPAPSGQLSMRVSVEDVVHVLSGANRTTPWHGASGLRNASDLGNAHTRIEKSLAREMLGPAGRLLPAPMDPKKGAPAALIEALKKLAGGPMMVESMSSGHGNVLRSDTRQGSDWKQQRIGPEPPAEMVELANQVQQTAGLILGIPAELMRSDASSASRREAWRMCYFSTILPLGRLVQHELRMKLEVPDLKISFDELGASDLQARARSLGAMVKAGVKLENAMKICGLTHE